MPDIIGIDHIYIAVTDLERSESFYDKVMIEALGFRKNTFTIGGDPHVQYFNRHFGYVLRPARTASAHDPYAPGLHHFCLRVESAEEVAEVAGRLQRLGIDATEAQLYPEYAPDYVATFFNDPDGIRLEVTNYRQERRDRHDGWQAKGSSMITLAKLWAYQSFSGDADGWARTTGGHDPSGIDDADWRMIDELRQALALAASGRASPEFCKDAERRLAACTDGETTRSALRTLASQDAALVIREAFADEAAVVASIISEANRDVAVRFGLDATNCPKHPSFCTEEWVKADLLRGERYFVLDDAGEPIACVAYETPDAHVAYLNRLSVLPASRRRGIGTRLVGHVIALARAASISSISIGVIGEHDDLQRWYRKQGFVDGEIKRFPHLPFTVKYMTYAVMAQ